MATSPQGQSRRRQGAHQDDARPRVAPVSGHGQVRPRAHRRDGFWPRRRAGHRTMRGEGGDRACRCRGGAAYESRPRLAHRNQLPGPSARRIQWRTIRKALDAAERVLRDAKKRGVLLGEVPALKSAAPKAERPRRSFLEPEQIAAVLSAADLIEAEHRGLTWQGVDLIRSSSRSAVSLARELWVSDTLIRKVRRGELWNGAAAARNRNDVPRRVVIDTLILGGLRASRSSAGSMARTSTSRLAACASRDRRRSPMPASATSRSCRRCAKA